jgi:hypothetical protein
MHAADTAAGAPAAQADEAGGPESAAETAQQD